MATLTAEEARRVVLGAQGFLDGAPARVDIRHVRKVLHRVRAIQIDSVNVAVRAHYMPLFSRLGPYRRELLDELAYVRREAFEYWGRQASYVPVHYLPAFRYRMRAMTPWHRVAALLEEHPGYIDAVYAEVAEHGPLTVSDLEDGGERTGPWWGHGKGKIALEWLFATGRLGVAERRNFSRAYDVFERTVPAEWAEAPALDADAAYRYLLAEVAAGLGLATEPALRDFWFMRADLSKRAFAELLGSGDIVEVDVEGWPRSAVMPAGAGVPRRRHLGAALLSPFDPLIWNRDRTERLFGFHYRIEIYVPEEKRQYGYYVYPLLLDGELVGRVDLKADRKGGTLLAKGAWHEDGHDAGRVAGAMAGELERMATWLGLDDVAVGRKGNLATALRSAL